MGLLPPAAQAAPSRAAAGSAAGDSLRSAGAAGLRGVVARAGTPSGAVARAAGAARSAGGTADRAGSDLLTPARPASGADPDGGDLAVPAVALVVVAVLLRVQRPRPPDGVPSSSLPAGPTGRSPPVPAAV